MALLCRSAGSEIVAVAEFSLRVNSGLVHQHDGDVVADRINASALITLKSLILFRQRGFADRADQNLEKSFVDHFGNFTPNPNDWPHRFRCIPSLHFNLPGEHTPNSGELRPYDRILGSSMCEARTDDSQNFGRQQDRY